LLQERLNASLFIYYESSVLTDYKTKCGAITMIGKRVTARIGMHEVEVKIVDFVDSERINVELPDRNVITILKRMIKEDI
jgi:hypothetical protein